jgi:hypothetical protein
LRAEAMLAMRKSLLKSSAAGELRAARKIRESLEV